MFRFFEGLVDPYEAHDDTDAPPRRLYAFMRAWSEPFMGVFALTAVVTFVVAAVEIGLIWYMGRVVDLLADADRATVWSDHGLELALAAAIVLLLRPLLQGLDVLLLNNTILPNYGTLYRWRAHKHVLRQSVGWFENDFAGRIANRVMQAPPAAGEAVFQIFDAIAFALAYLVGAAILLADADPRLAIPLLVWFVLYGLLVRWTMTRVGPASKASSDARSTTTGRVVDAYTNIHSVKLFAHGGRELAHGREAIEHTRATFAREMRLYTIMDVALVTLNGLLIVGVVGWAVALWAQGAASGGRNRGRLGAGAAAQRHDGLDHVGRLVALPLARASWPRAWRPSPSPSRSPTRRGPAAPARRGPRRVRPGDASLRARPGRAGGSEPDGGPGREAGPRRPLGRGQVHARQAPAALLRPRGRPDPDRRPGHPGRDAGLPAALDRHGAAGQLAPAPLGARQHPLRAARRVGGGDGRGRAPRLGARVRPRPEGPRGPARLRRAGR